MIPNDIIERIKDETDIVKIIGSYVDLEQRGKNFFGLCPFHDDSSPSMSVSPEKKIYHCFSCGAGGNVVTFVQNHESIHYVDALEKLANNVGIDISKYRNTNPANEQKNELYKVNAFTKDFYKYFLKTTEGNIPLNYLTKTRKLTPELIEHFEIGYAPKNRKNLIDIAKKNGIQVQLLEKNALVRDGENGYYSLFSDRVMFPIKNENGEVVGFSGRTLSNETNQAKYINTSETDIFNKSRLLYNLNDAKLHIKRLKYVILFEGFMDVIAAYNSGVKNSVATMGTAFTKYHAGMIKKYTDKVIICYDGDEAGRKSTIAVSRILQEENIIVKAVMIPNGMDPDEYLLANDSNSFMRLINNASDVSTYIYVLLKSKCDFANHTDVLTFVQKVYEYLLQLKSNSAIEYILKMLSADTSISYESLLFDYNKFKTKLNKYNENSYSPKTTSEQVVMSTKSSEISINKVEFEEVILLSIMNDKELFAQTKDAFINIIKNDDIRKIFLYALNVYEHYKDISLSQVLQELTSENEMDLFLFLTDLHKKVENKMLYDIEDLNKYINIIINKNIKQEINLLREILKKTNDFEKQQECMKKIKQLQKEKRGAL